MRKYFLDKSKMCFDDDRLNLKNLIFPLKIENELLTKYF